MDPLQQPAVAWPKVGLIESYFPSLRALSPPNGPYIVGSGTLISPRVILTAAHNLFDKSLGGPTDHVKVTLPGLPPMSASRFNWVKEWEATTDDDVNSQSCLSPYDCGVILLDAPVPDNRPYAKLRQTNIDEMQALAGVWVLGYPSDEQCHYPPRSLAGGLCRVQPQVSPSLSYRVAYPINSFHGMSGGPVATLVDDEFKVYAVNTSRFPVQGQDWGNGLLIYKALGDLIVQWAHSV